MFIACILKFAPKKVRASAIRQRSLHPAVCRPSPDTVLPPGGGVVYVEGRRHGVAPSRSLYDGRRLRRGTGARSSIQLVALF